MKKLLLISMLLLPITLSATTFKASWNYPAGYSSVLFNLDCKKSTDANFTNVISNMPIYLLNGTFTHSATVGETLQCEHWATDGNGVSLPSPRQAVADYLVPPSIMPTPQSVGVVAVF